MMEQQPGERVTISYFVSLVVQGIISIKWLLFFFIIFLHLCRFYLKEFRGSRRWLLFLEGECLKTQQVNLVSEGQLTCVKPPMEF